MSKCFFAVLLCLLLAGCVTAKVDPNAVQLGVAFSWKDTKACSDKSPMMKVSGLPVKTKTLDVKLVDLDVTSWDHGGGKLAYGGSGVIPAGALKAGYNGPCPPDGTHRYQFSVKAINAEGVIIGQGKSMHPFPPK